MAVISPVAGDEMDLLKNVHIGLVCAEVTEVKGAYHYYHYGCDGTDDRGWGCGYRTLQSMCSWIKDQLPSRSLNKIQEVPSLKEIQETLVKIGDKPSNFIGSKQWIGSVEIGFVIDTLYDVPCKIIHIPSGRDLVNHISTLEKHFIDFGSPIMMGGDTDNSSKCIMGVGSDPLSLLILDPHFYGKASIERLQSEKWVTWRTLDFFVEDSFYNLCLPQLIAVK